MMIPKELIAGALAASFASATLPALAEVYISIDPPARRAEHFDPRPGYVVVPGSWNYNKGKYEWHDGRYVPEKKGYAYQNDRWVLHDNNKWTMQRGGWSKDTDHDGTPDNKDKYPNNPRKQ
jgi:YXWGXW repeat-containing protein